jgi:hypothetical protein
MVLNYTSTLQIKSHFSVLLQHQEQLLNMLFYAKGDPLPLCYPSTENPSDSLRLVSYHNVVTYILVGNGNFTIRDEDYLYIIYILATMRSKIHFAFSHICKMATI